MTKSSIRRKSLRKMYKWNKERAKAGKPLPKSVTTPASFVAPLVDNTPFRIPRVKKALSRIVGFEVSRPGEFGAWLTDLHIEHFRAGIQERLDRERDNKNSETGADTKDAIIGPVYIT